jgi:hypothetical protein
MPSRKALIGLLFLSGKSVRAAQYMKVKLNDLEIGAQW